MKTFTRVLTFVAGLLLFFAGIYFLVRPGVSFLSIAMLLGLIMIFSGIVSIVEYFADKETNPNASMELIIGILTLIFGILVVLNQGLTDLVLPYLFGAWLLFAGIMRSISSVTNREFIGSVWGVFLLIGILCIVAGFICLYHPLMTAFTMGSLLGIVFIFQGINSAILAFANLGDSKENS